ncbi:hypothetical protein [Rosenbergiella nectarea]|uniref:hypothetical protein n=1 Tax=Rosenbergiella nectarea TaxID=988801 RepID=UPI001BDA61EC|nr:hypothetical protein [Rosenbergiella nectarea]MBT0730872.1 hypothetical protein [Rosenbergiella nectarea subsp. apis]
MFSQGWQIGLHINTAQVSVVAIKGNRYKWCLQGWWVFPLDEPVFTSTGLLAITQEFRSILIKLRTYFPYRYSLRVSYPVQCVLLRTLSLPSTTLQGLPLERFVQLSVERLFSHLHELTWDYCLGPDTSTEISVTVTRNKVLKDYYALFKNAGLTVDVVELASTALYPLLDPRGSSTLIVEDREIWLWATCHQQQYHHGQCLKVDFPTTETVIHSIAINSESYFFAGDQNDADQINIDSYSLLKAIEQSPPVIASRPDLVVALGLAMRKADQL